MIVPRPYRHVGLGGEGGEGGERILRISSLITWSCAEGMPRASSGKAMRNASSGAYTGSIASRRPTLAVPPSGKKGNRFAPGAVWGDPAALAAAEAERIRRASVAATSAAHVAGGRLGTAARSDATASPALSGRSRRDAKRERSGGSRGLPAYVGCGRPMATTTKSRCATRCATPPLPLPLPLPPLPRMGVATLGAERKVPSSSAISRFSSRLFSSGSTLRSAFSTPSRRSTRPWIAARSGGASAYRMVPSASSRRCFRSASVVSRVMPMCSTSRRRCAQSHSTRWRARAPGSASSSMSCPSASCCIIQRAESSTA